MTPVNPRTLAAVLAVLGLPGAGGLAAERGPGASKLDLAPGNAARVGAAIRPQGNEWRHLKVRWYTDIVAARKKAAREDRPILVFRTGGAGYNDPLGQC